MATFDVMRIRKMIPQLSLTIRGKPLVYLDNGATTLKPSAVIERTNRYYLLENANVHRGAHFLAEQGTGLYESARTTVAKFLQSDGSGDIVFTRGTTESLNLVATTMAHLGARDSRGLQPDDEVLVTELEHHSNIVPWQLACEQAGAKLRAIPITGKGEIDLAALRSMLNAKTKIVAFSSASNVLGTITDPAAIAAVVRAGAKQAVLAVDAAQSVTAGPIDVKAWGVDFVAFSGHKLFAPLGIGILWAKKPWLEILPPYQGGGSMIDNVTFAKTTWADVPHKFEAGTPNVGGAVGLATAIEWLDGIGREAAFAHARSLAEQARAELEKISGVTVYGDPSKRTALVSFNLGHVHASDVGAILDQQGIAIRTGHHCCQPLMHVLGVAATARASFSIYNTHDEVRALIQSVLKAKEILL